MNLKISPVVRISFGLIMLTLSILFVGDWLGLIPRREALELEHRKKFSESLAVQFSSLAQAGDSRHIRTILEAIVERDADIESAAFRSLSAGTVVEVGEHAEAWLLDEDEQHSTDEQIIVPIFQGNKRWGSVEVRFAGSNNGWISVISDNSFLVLALFITVSGFSLYLLFLKRVLRQLDPSQVVPERVKAAFDSLAEGVLILDEEGHIVLANDAFSNNSGVDSSRLIGASADSLNWSTYQTDLAVKTASLPWMRVMELEQSLTGEKLTMHQGSSLERSYTVNCTLIQDAKDNVRGVIATFDDLTELEKKNEALKDTLTTLKKSQTDVNIKNKELEYLATRDPLTNCLNRRSFTEQYTTLFERAKTYKSDLVCVMADIDHFKRVNDNYGHGVGDKVIKFVADVLQKQIRRDDVLGRYGGEEFCIILDGSSLEQAAVVAERMRAEITNGDPSLFTSALGITASFGLASIHDEPDSQDELVNKADGALYQAKESGRNKVMVWSENQLSPESTERNADTQQDISTKGLGEQNSIDTVANNPQKQAEERAREFQKIAEEKAQQLDRLLSYDRLTQLPERDLFIDRVEQALPQARRGGSVVSVISLGLDNLNRVKDTLGHECAEEYLQEVATRLTGVLRGSDTVLLLADPGVTTTVSKLGESVFGILLPAVKDSLSIPWIIKRILHALGEPLYIRDQNIVISGSIGVSVSSTDGSDADTLIRHASISRYYAEQTAGVNNIEYYSEDISRISRVQLDLESEMSEAIEKNEFFMVYQPKITLGTGEICGFESLIRWNHPVRGLLTPNEFIGIAERTRLINLIGDWVLRESCMQLIEFQKSCEHDLCISVNLSPVQFSQPDIVERTLGILRDIDMDPAKLEIELTESSLLENMDETYRSLSQFQEKGISVSIDDFGTGYSGLSYLRSLPVNNLKIDRSFVAEVGGKEHETAIVTAVIGMSKALGLKVIAEGVETSRQLEVLKSMGCDEAQGYFFSRPISAVDAQNLLVGASKLDNLV